MNSINKSAKINHDFGQYERDNKSNIINNHQNSVVMKVIIELSLLSDEEVDIDCGAYNNN
ncbi:40471_t:CDS:2 [Gigaspora margarita]|uniref:40471_t:CDS:1 n=1 Tax=Gigaspora margarita TaxID=4874 RepID=A0ABN7V813_GIGMA|nr:40471_t:CDS:2 [Gigaspora margarita]